MLLYQYKNGNIEDVKSDMLKFSDMFLVEDQSGCGTVGDNWNMFKMTLKQSMDRHIPQKIIYFLMEPSLNDLRYQTSLRLEEESLGCSQMPLKQPCLK